MSSQSYTLLSQKFYTYLSRESKFKISMFHISIVFHIPTYFLMTAVPLSYLKYQRNPRSCTWKSTRSDLHAKSINLRKGKMVICPTTLELVYTTCLQRVRALPRRWTFVTALRNACEGDKERYEKAARARDRDKQKGVKGG